jgi:hypothetical protein
MTPLEQEIFATAEIVAALPECVERELAIRSLRHARSLLDRHFETAVDALYRAKTLCEKAKKETRQ